MRIAQVAPLTESVPPQLYGGTERVVAYLTDELVRLGHDVTLFASGDSRTAGRLVPIWPRRSGSTARAGTRSRRTCSCWRRSRSAPGNSTSCISTSRSSTFRSRGVFRLHTSRRCTDASTSLSSCRCIASSTTSRSSRSRTPSASRFPTQTGLAPFITDCRSVSCRFIRNRGKYLAFLGRIAPEKRVDRAIAIATACNLPLKIAAKVDPADREYFEREIRQLLSHPLVEFIGEIDEQQKGDFLGGASACSFRSTGRSHSVWS